MSSTPINNIKDLDNYCIKVDFQYVTTDKDGYILADEKMKSNLEGVYAVGDITHKQVHQFATAVNYGAIAAINVAAFLNNK